MEQYKQEFIEFMVESEVLKFGEFTLKSGRKSPFFMNAGAYVTGEQLHRLGLYYARAGSMTPIDPSRSPAHTSSDPPAAPKIAMPMSTCLRNARGRRTDTTATATSAAPFANVHSSRMKESCVSYRGNRCTFSDQLLNVSNANARPCANENKPAFGGATPSPFCSRDLNMPVL